MGDDDNDDDDDDDDGSDVGDDDDDADGTGGDTTDGGSTGPGTTAGGDPGGPTIVSLDLNVSTIAPGETFTVSAIVTDPDGVDDVIGGQLQSGDGEIVFGTFETQAQEGAYSLVISFEEIGQAAPAAGTTSSEAREFRAEFFDQSGAASWQTIGYTLQCDAGYLCDERCLDVECIPDLVPCGDGSPCVAGSCWPVQGDGVGQPCSSHEDCSSLCLASTNSCTGAWCDLADPSCPAGQYCQAFQIGKPDLGTETCQLPQPGACMLD